MKTARELLDVLDEFFVNANLSERRRVWALLTVLRGPDFESDDAKRGATAVLRALILPHKTAVTREEALKKGLVRDGWWFSGTTGMMADGSVDDVMDAVERSLSNKVSSSGKRGSPHFWNHVRSAITALREIELLEHPLAPPKPKTIWED